MGNILRRSAVLLKHCFGSVWELCFECGWLGALPHVLEMVCCGVWSWIQASPMSPDHLSSRSQLGVEELWQQVGHSLLSTTAAIP